MFDLVAPYHPAGDQPQAIAKLTEGLLSGAKHQVLLGVTGFGKTLPHLLEEDALDVVEGDHHQQHEKDHDANHVDLGLDVRIHVSATDGVDSHEEDPTTVEPGQWQQVENAKRDRDQDQNLQELQQTLLRRSGHLLGNAERPGQAALDLARDEIPNVLEQHRRERDGHDHRLLHGVEERPASTGLAEAHADHVSTACRILARGDLHGDGRARARDLELDGRTVRGTHDLGYVGGLGYRLAAHTCHHIAGLKSHRLGCAALHDFVNTSEERHV